MNINQALERAASNVPNDITPEEVQRAAQYAFRAPTQDDIIRYMMGQGATQQAASLPSPDMQAAMMAGTPTQVPARAQQTPPSIERAIQLQDTPDKLRESDVLYPLPTKGLTSWGPVDIYHRPFVDNDDGSTSTMVTSIYDDDGGYHVIAGVGSDGTMYSDDDAIRRAQKVGDNKIATFNNLADAEAFDDALHRREVMRLQYRNNPQALQQYAYDLERADHPDRFDANGNYITPQEQAAVATQTAPVASQAASTAAQVQNNATDAAGAQAAPQTDYSQQLNDVIAQANRVGIGAPMSLGERGVLSQILGAKDMYNVAQDDNGRAAAHALADAYRQAGQQYGLNDTSAGLDATQLRALLQTDYNMGVNNAMQGKTSAEYFDDQYNALRQAGLTRSEATDEAARRAQRYQNERVRNLTNAYYTYGVDRDGSMNNNGAAILNLIYDEQPASAAMGMQNYATPIQNWKFNKNQEAANNAYNQKVDFGQRTFGWNKGLLDDKIAAQLKMNADNNALREYLANLQSADKRYAVDNAVARGGSGGKSGGASGSGGSSGSGKGLPEGQKEIANYASNLLNDVKNGEASPQSLHDYLYSDDVEKKLDSGDLDSLRMLDYAGLFYWYKKNGIEGDPHGNSSDQQMAEVCRQIANNTSDEWKEQYVPGYDFSAWKD
ncbi:hypothetical protein [uncultured Mitsuokella sp.]|uniref:hypothetical protein n=1 Tax=uncultured Mitsuokella sp. TaxID=453120 RepID=UPI00259A4441|nr:hypothetical protein [uncultured Mitsuokella sp.]